MSQFKHVGSVHPGRSVFNLSYEKKFTCDMGQLIPVMCDEVVPGDIFSIGNEVVIRFLPLVAPVLHEVNCYVHYFFVPYRLLWTDWENFITGGVNGTDTSILPRWTTPDTSAGSLWDFLGFPVGITPDNAHLPMIFPRSAYNMIYNQFYRDETTMPIVSANDGILYRAWEKDYFTSALPWQQRGTAPAMPIAIGGASSAIWDLGTSANLQTPTFNASEALPVFGNSMFNNNDVPGSPFSATSFNIADLRLAFQVQRWLERNARAGVRYTEFLGAHFGVHPRDDRLQRPEYIGGSKSPVIFSEVLQTSETKTTPQGTLAGHGITVDRRFCAKYRVQEFVLIMGIMSVMPRSSYSQGINRQWLRTTKYDFYFPEFANLSEQAINMVELYASTFANDNAYIFGYQGRYDEMRYKPNMVVSGMRLTFNYWHLSREFGSTPYLNSSFLKCVPRKDIFAVQGVNDPTLVVSFGNVIKAIRPMPIMSNPGLIDH